MSRRRPGSSAARWSRIISSRTRRPCGDVAAGKNAGRRDVVELTVGAGLDLRPPRVVERWRDLDADVDRFLMREIACDQRDELAGGDVGEVGVDEIAGVEHPIDDLQIVMVAGVDREL